MPSPAELLHLAGLLAVATAIAAYPADPAERFGRLRTLIELAMLALAALTLAWLTFIRPVIELELAPPDLAFWLAARPVFDLIWITFLLRHLLLRTHRTGAGAIGFMAPAALVLFFADLAGAYQVLQGGLGQAGLGDASRMAAYLWMAVSLRRPLSEWGDTGPRENVQDRRRRVRRFDPYLPIAFTYAVVGVTTFDRLASGRFDPFGLGTSLGLCLLLLVRQGAIAGQNEMRQYAALVNTSADLAFICRPDGLLRLANPALLRAIGASDEIAGRLSLAEFLLSDAPLPTILDAAGSAGWSQEVSFRRLDGSVFPVLLALRPVHHERRAPPMLVGSAHDLTGILEREGQLRRALEQVDSARQELAALNAALEERVRERTGELETMVADLDRLNQDLRALDRLKTEFVALVSHELRAPLTNILMGVELLLRSQPRLDPGAHESLSLVRQETERLTRFVETILDLSALDAGRFPLRPNSVDVERVVRASIGRFPAQAGAERIRIGFEAGLPRVRADERALGVVIFHLLDNALKYSPRGAIQVKAHAVGDRVRIAVADQGSGIPPEERERVFEVFHRLDARDSREVYGHGLGLPLARRLMQAMSGDIVAEEAEGGGACLVASLPQAE